jgi:rod shape-determining protein MreD
VNKTLSVTLALVGAYVLQVAVAPQLAVFGVVPNFLFLVVVTIALTQGAVPGGIAGFFGGLIFDLLNTSIVGPSALVLAVVGYVAGALNANLFAEGWLLPVTVVAIASLATEVSYGLVLAVLGTGPGFWSTFLTVMLPSVIYHSALAVIVYPLLARLLRTERPMKSFRRLA